MSQRHDAETQGVILEKKDAEPRRLCGGTWKDISAAAMGARGAMGAMGTLGALGALGAIGAIAAGGALGSVARHGMNIAVAHVLGRPAPYATAAVNLLGSAAVGLLAGLIASGRLSMSPTMRAFVFVGLLGGFTTFSSLMLDTLTLTHTGERSLAVSNVFGQTAIGLIAVYAGYYLAAN